MADTQTVIVYRNRVEHDFYESGMLIPLIGGLGVGLLTMLFLAWLVGKLSRDWRGPNGLVVGACCVASLCAGVLTFHWLAI